MDLYGFLKILTIAKIKLAKVSQYHGRCYHMYNQKAKVSTLLTFFFHIQVIVCHNSLSKGNLSLHLDRERGNGDGQFICPSGLAIDGVLYVCDYYNSRIQVFYCFNYTLSFIC